MAAKAGLNSVDGDGDQWREVTSNERTTRRPKVAEQDMRGLMGFGVILKIRPDDIYISRPYRCDRVEQLGGTKMQNRKRLPQLGVTEKF